MAQKVRIERLPVHGDPDHNHAWVPSIGGKVIERNGQPAFSIQAAKDAVASHLGLPVAEIKFQIGS